MLCYRLVVLIFVIVFTACMTCSIFFPVFRKTTTNGAIETREAVYYWYTESCAARAPGAPGKVIVRYYTRELLCPRARVFFIASSAISVAGAGIGAVACLVLACWTTATGGHILHVGAASLTLTFITMACAGVTVGLVTHLFTNDFCLNDPVAFYRAPQKDGYRMVEGFGLLCTAAGGFFFMMVVLVFGLCRSGQPLEEPAMQEHHEKGTSGSHRCDRS
ncbi:hypothetical protein JKF63_05256 [Porcisia hertigi]|uniref:Uncharacterized protein n=1 Tax=Porcisia hertigi TaxID=2761500 RepID=A0A836ITC0_9TRYP|nr:hypothetical protein JKF63_05256 [Porcisia hertigi]